MTTEDYAKLDDTELRQEIARALEPKHLYSKLDLIWRGPLLVYALVKSFLGDWIPHRKKKEKDLISHSNSKGV